MQINTLSPFLRRVLLADALVSGATGLLLFIGANFLAELLQLPAALLRPAGLFLLPYSALVAYITTRVSPPRWALWAIVITNTLWAADSLVLLVSGQVAPNLLGNAFVIAQALVVAAFAVAQTMGLRQPAKLAA
jgi:hypothetical protein